MRLIRIRLRHFRGVHDREVALAESGVTLLQGENEVGKTTTIRALDLLVDVPDSSRRTEVRAAAPAGVDAGPEVEAEIVTGPYRFVYRKRWLRRPITELTVLSPAREQLVGADAHARVAAMLDETIDRGLWKALRVEQHTAIGQAELGGRDALTRALDRAAGTDSAGTDSVGPDTGGHDTDLVERAAEELRRYRTPTGRATAELRAAEERLETARAEHDRCRAAIETVEHDVATRDRLDADLDALRRRRREHQTRVAELEDEWTALQSRLRTVDTARERAGAARERATAADTRVRVRAGLVDELAEAEAAVGRADARVAEHERSHAASRAERSARHTEHRAAREEAGRARQAARAAEEALALARDHAELADLDTALRRMTDAETGVHAAEGELAGITVDDATVDRLDDLSRDVLRAEAARTAGAAGVEVVAPDDASAPDLLLDGSPAPLGRGETRRIPVHAAVTVSLPGRLEVRVRPGLDDHGLADAVRHTTDALAAACADAGVADLAAARAEVRRAENVRRRRDEHRASLDRELAGRAVAGRTVAEVRAARDRLRARVDGAAASVEGTPVDGPTVDGPTIDEPTRVDGSAPVEVTVGAADLDGLRVAADDARATADHRASRADETDRLCRLADDTVADAGTEAALLAQRAADARHAHGRCAADLADARAEASDATLAAEHADLLARAREAENAHQALAATLAAADPGTVEARVVNARGVDERLATETAALERDRAETTGRLQSAGHQGWHDQLVTASVELDAARYEYDATARRARAAARLYETLVRHRDAVRRAYVAPFRAQVERLARIVFGPTLALEVDAALRITHRTLDGVTVTFDELSSGAKEQLALCARLACAALVDPAEGVPVVIDDALGHSDPERLDRLGAVFTAATADRAGQVLVLTCTPERYRGVGAATVVSLAPSRPPAREAAEREVAVVAAHGVVRDVGEDPPELELPRTG